MSDDRYEEWLDQLRRADSPPLQPWERVNLLELVAERGPDTEEVAEALFTGPVPVWRLDDILNIAAAHGNEQVGLRALAAGATARPLPLAAASGLAALTRALIDAGARFNRRFERELAPIHAAVVSTRAAETAAVLVEAACDLTVLTPGGERAWDLASEGLAETLKAAVGQHGPQWFREAQLEDIDHFIFVRDDAMFGFNPNDVQMPIWTGNEDEGFGWPNTAAQARTLLEDNRVLRAEVEWFLPFLDRLESGEDFSLQELGARVPRRRQPSWR